MMESQKTYGGWGQLRGYTIYQGNQKCECERREILGDSNPLLGSGDNKACCYKYDLIDRSRNDRILILKTPGGSGITIRSQIYITVVISNKFGVTDRRP
jgi:hypothetical protein